MDITSNLAPDLSPTTTSDLLFSIPRALAATLDPHVPHVLRQQALEHLERLKTQPEAPQYGFTLADDRRQDAAVRYFGLQLLEHAVRYHWGEYGAAQTAQIRKWVEILAGNLRRDDALFVRNKIAQVWVEVAKRCWGAGGEEDEDEDEDKESWTEMDELLVTMWTRPMSENNGTVDKVFVLGVLEALSEDVMNGEDGVAEMRGEVLGAAVNEIMIPNGFYEAHSKTKGSRRREVRAGREGWLVRLCHFLGECVKEVRQARTGGIQTAREAIICAIKALSALRPTMHWISLRAVLEADVVDYIMMAFHADDVSLQTVATDTLTALLSRPYHAHFHDAWTTMQQQALRPDRVAMMKRSFEAAACTPGQDDEKYALQKKLAAVLAVQAHGVMQLAEVVSSDGKTDLPGFFALLLQVLQSGSLTVSVAALHTWSKLLAVTDPTIIDHVTPALGPLLGTCSERLLRYEVLLPADGKADEVVQYLDHDFDTVPERHAFLGNYRRYCVSTIQAIARIRPLDALQHVLGQMRRLLADGPYTRGRGFDAHVYSPRGSAVLRFDAQNTVVAAALKGFALWRQDTAALGPEAGAVTARAAAERAAAERALQEWGAAAIHTHVDDPEVAGQVLQTLVGVLRVAADPPPMPLVLQVVQHVLTMRLYDDPSAPAFSDAVRAFENLRVLELQKLALAFSPALLEVYHELEPRVGVLVQKHAGDARLASGYTAFLFMIVHRAPGLDEAVRRERLREMLRPIYHAWSSPELAAAVQTLPAFCDALGLGGLDDFFRAHAFDRVADWAATPLDAAGQRRQQQIRDATDALPLRLTKTLLAASTERAEVGGPAWATAAALWGDLLPTMLPVLLPMVRQAQAFHDMANWSHLPPELQRVVRRSLHDRFWQAGISAESKDAFYARVAGSRESYEGFASAVRGAVRAVREQGYHVLYLLAKFGDAFFGHADALALPLADALFADAGCLPANHLHPVINLATGLVQRCPPRYRARFLPPLLTRLFVTLDAKITADWAALGSAVVGDGGNGVGAERTLDEGDEDEDDLGEEMRAESVLRQLTYSMVSFVPFLLEYDQQTTHQHQQRGRGHMNGNGVVADIDDGPGDNNTQPGLADLVLADPAVLEPMILFCTHALRMKDSRCCSTICRVFRTLIPRFQGSSSTASSITPKPEEDNSPSSTISQVREFICTEVLKACITSLHEPYFAELQKDLAALIAQIVRLYAPLTDTPHVVLASLPDMPAERVARAVRRIVGSTLTERQQRGVVLELLERVRGIGIHEAGKIGGVVGRLKRRGGSGRGTGVLNGDGGIGGVGEEGGVELDGLTGLFGGD